MFRLCLNLPFVVLICAFTFAAEAKEIKNIFSMQKQSLHEFAEKASQAKDLKEFLDQSHLHWQVGFSKMREAAKGKALPKILTSKDGIEIFSEGKKVSVSPTGHLFSFLLNGREFTIKTPLDLMATAAAIENFLKDEKKVSFSFFQQAYASGSPNPLSMGLGAAFTLVVIDCLRSYFFPDSDIADVYCETDGSFTVYGDKNKKSGLKDELIKFNIKGKELRLAGKDTTFQALYQDVEKDLKAKGDKDVKGSLEKAKSIIEEQFQYASNKCKGRYGFTGSWGEALEASIVNNTKKSLRSDSIK